MRLLCPVAESLPPESATDGMMDDMLHPLPDSDVRGDAAHLQRILARSSDRITWLKHRALGVTATDVARLSSPKALQSVAW